MNTKIYTRSEAKTMIETGCEKLLCLIKLMHDVHLDDDIIAIFAETTVNAMEMTEAKKEFTKYSQVFPTPVASIRNRKTTQRRSY